MTGTRNTWSARKPLWLGLLALLVLVGGFGGWAMTAQIGGAVIASGQIIVDQNRQIVQHSDGGIVSAIMVEEGSSVAQGDVLIRLDADQINAELAIFEGQLFEILARRARFEAERDEADTLAFDPILSEIGTDTAAELLSGQERLFRSGLVPARKETCQLVLLADRIAIQLDGIPLTP